ncbi:MAG: YeeE/YedE thiosulfate transporter family protein [Bdellovibrionota bacterium]
MNLGFYILPLVGGLIIGLAVTVMLLFNGRITGISGILASSLVRPRLSGSWTFTFLLGLLAGGALVHAVAPEFFVNQSGRSLPVVVVAGFLVGIGTVMGGGCTSGHGVCGISRLSLRSVIATVTFIVFGFVSVALARMLMGVS